MNYLSLLLKKGVEDWTEKDHQLFEKLTGKKKTVTALLKGAIDEKWGEEDEETVNKAKSSLPKNVVKVRDDETSSISSSNAKPFTYEVKEGDTLKKIAEKFSVSYGELCNHLMSKFGSTSIHVGDSIEIPRYFFDLSQA